jgi:hypothetical protein
LVVFDFGEISSHTTANFDLESDENVVQELVCEHVAVVEVVAQQVLAVHGDLELAVSEAESELEFLSDCEWESFGANFSAP